MKFNNLAKMGLLRIYKKVGKIVIIGEEICFSLDSDDVPAKKYFLLGTLNKSLMKTRSGLPENLRNETWFGKPLMNLSMCQNLTILSAL